MRSEGKIMQSLRNYGRSTHNLSKAWRSTAAPGLLYPFMTAFVVNGDTWDIDLQGLMRTIPTSQPLYGRFKVQMDLFYAPSRLYNAKLHNNPLSVGIDMKNIRFPKMTVNASVVKDPSFDVCTDQISPSSLMHYLGLSSVGNHNQWAGLALGDQRTVSRMLNAEPFLIYFDIVKNYYANLQEETAYVMGPNTDPVAPTITSIVVANGINQTTYTPVDGRVTLPSPLPPGTQFEIYGVGLDPRWLRITLASGQMSSLRDYANAGYIGLPATSNPGQKIAMINYTADVTNGIQISPMGSSSDSRAVLRPFPLKNIDKMREWLLQQPNNDDGADLFINGETAPTGPGQDLPYNVGDATLVQPSWPGQVGWSVELTGLCPKTYLSDRFNNWLDTELIEGASGVTAMTNISVAADSTLNLDTLNVMQKMYNLLNRVVVAGNSYKAWQIATYGEAGGIGCETPMFIGGGTYEVEFDEVISTAATDTSAGYSPLGSLSGRGTGSGKARGTKFKVKEIGYIMGIMSITPRLDYSQGNKWWTQLRSFDDVHKPELDQIGFQDLLTDEFAAFDSISVAPDSLPYYWSAGKQPAYIEYQTDVNETHGDFALNQSGVGMMNMTLNRRYEMDYDTGRLADCTTYIDPAKFNYAFAETHVGAENFWPQIGIKAIARRKMSARIIPNL